MAKDGEPKRSKKQKKQQQAEDEQQTRAPADLPERLRQQHQFVTSGADMNFHVRLCSIMLFGFRIMLSHSQMHGC